MLLSKRAIRHYKNQSRVYRFVVLVAFASLMIGCQRQDRFPSRPLQLICPWAVGGGTDRCSREVARLLETELGQPVNVVNATGGAGVTGHSRGARARPDGYTLVMMTVEINMLRHRGLTELGYQDFEPLGMINRDAAALFVRTGAPWKQLADLTEEIRQSPGKLTGSGTAKGGIWHLALAGWLKTVGLGSDAVNWIPSTGAGPSLQELAGGGIDMVCCSLPEAQTLLDAGEVRCLGVMSNKRIAEYPDVPTFLEQDVHWVMGGWRGIGLPLGVPRPIRDRLYEALEKVVHSEPFLTFMKHGGFDASWEGPEQFSSSLHENDKTLGGLLRDQFSELRTEQFGPMFFPKIVGTAFLLVTVLMVSQSYVEHHRRQQLQAPEPELVYHLQSRRLFHLGLVLLAIVGFITFVETLGFVLTAAMFLAVLLVLSGARWSAIILCVLLTVVPIYEIFARQFRVPLPVGIFGW